jgi:hypothetical protein
MTAGLEKGGLESVVQQRVAYEFPQFPFAPATTMTVCEFFIWMLLSFVSAS